MGSFLGSTMVLPNSHMNVPGALIGSSYYLFGISGSNAPGVTDTAPLNGMGGLGAWGGASVTMTHNRWTGPLVVTGPKMLLYGGQAYSSGIIKLDPSTDMIPIVPSSAGDTQLGSGFSNLSGSPPSSANYGAVATQVGNYVYVLGGFAGGTDLNTIDVATLK
jgi:hypothetical protein